MKRLAEFDLDIRILSKNIGYELRCAPPIAFDREYTRYLGYGVIDFLLRGEKNAVVYRLGDTFATIPFSNLIDKNTKQSRIRLVDVDSDTYHIDRNYMIRLEASDFLDAELANKMSQLCGVPAEALQKELLGN